MTNRMSLSCGVRMAFDDSGSAAGTPVVLLHALAGSSATWDATAAALRARGLRTITVDLRGHGRSGRARSYAVDTYWPDVVAVLDHLNLDQVDVIGHSLGGQVALRLAMHQPWRIRRLVLEEPALPTTDSDTMAQALRTPKPHWLLRMLGLARLVRVLFIRRFDWRVLGPALRYVRSPDPAFWASVSTLPVPTLVLARAVHSGEAEPWVHLARQLRRADIVHIGSSHHLHADHPDAFVEAVTAFLERR